MWQGRNHYEWLREKVAKVQSPPDGFQWEYDEASSIGVQSESDDRSSGSGNESSAEEMEEEGWITQCRVLDLPVDERFRSISDPSVEIIHSGEVTMVVFDWAHWPKKHRQALLQTSERCLMNFRDQRKVGAAKIQDIDRRRMVTVLRPCAGRPSLSFALIESSFCGRPMDVGRPTEVRRTSHGRPSDWPCRAVS